jgi:hypothetical protein
MIEGMPILYLIPFLPEVVLFVFLVNDIGYITWLGTACEAYII